MKQLRILPPVLEFSSVGPTVLRADPSANVALVIELQPPKRATWAVGLGGEVVARREVVSEVSTMDAIERAKQEAKIAWLLSAGLQLEELDYAQGRPCSDCPTPDVCATPPRSHCFRPEVTKVQKP